MVDGSSEARVHRRVGQSLRDVLREAFVSGLAVVVPVLVTVFVLLFVVNSLYRYLDVPSAVVGASGPITLLPGALEVRPTTLVELSIPFVLVVLILLVGIVVNSSRYGERAVDYFDYVIARIPGVGSVYESFRQMSDVMLESDAQNFREVKLVEFPHEGAYTLGFVTTQTPEALTAPTGHDEMVTLFLPLAPNPVMGGHLVHMPTDRVMDVDMTVEEGIRAVVTSGVAVGQPSTDGASLSADDLRDLATAERADQRFAPERESPDVRRRDPPMDQEDRYDGAVSPGHADTPHDIVRRERDDGGGDSGTEDRPAELADRDAAEREPTHRRPAELADRDAAEREPTDRRPAELAGRDDDDRESADENPAELAGHEEDDA
jgi:uncharacterized membrane protein